MVNLYLAFYGVIALANGMAGFALSIWIYEETGSIGAFASVGVASLLPALILTPFAGMIIDRFGIRISLVFSSTSIAIGWLFLMLLGYVAILPVNYLPSIAMSVLSECRIPVLSLPEYTLALMLLVGVVSVSIIFIFITYSRFRGNFRPVIKERVGVF